MISYEHTIPMKTKICKCNIDIWVDGNRELIVFGKRFCINNMRERGRVSHKN